MEDPTPIDIVPGGIGSGDSSDKPAEATKEPE
jgi:hypothetical protein